MGRFWSWLRNEQAVAEATFYRDAYLNLNRAHRSMYGAGEPGNANCDTLWQRRHAELEKEYVIARRETDRAMNENFTLKVRVAALSEQLREYGTSPGRIWDRYPT